MDHSATRELFLGVTRRERRPIERCTRLVSWLESELCGTHPRTKGTRCFAGEYRRRSPKTRAGSPDSARCIRRPRASRRRASRSRMKRSSEDYHRAGAAVFVSEDISDLDRERRSAHLLPAQILQPNADDRRTAIGRTKVAALATGQSSVCSCASDSAPGLGAITTRSMR